MATRRPHAAYLKKPTTPVHEGFAEFITKTTGAEVDAVTVGLVQRLYPVYLKSPAVQKAKAAEQEARDKAAREKAEQKAARLRNRLARIEEDRRKVLAELGLDEDLDTGEPEPGDDVADEEPATPTPAKRSRAKAAAKAVVIEAEDRFTADDDDEDGGPEVTVGDDDADEQDEQGDDDLFEDDDNDEEDW